MNFEESKQILELINSNHNFLLHCHQSPDLDSVASAMSFAKVLKEMGKKVDVVCKDPIPEGYDYISGVKNIKVTELEKVDFSNYDFWVVLDSEKWDQAGISFKPNIKVINIDHHPANNIGGEVSVLKNEASSTCELLTMIFEDWSINIDKELATMLLSGITYDSNFFQQKNTYANTHLIAFKLMESGADNNYINFKVKRCNDINIIKLWGEFDRKLKLDKKYNFVWTAIPYETYKKHLMAISSTAEYSNMIARTIVGSNFSIVMTEKTKGLLTMSIRSRIPGFDVSLIAHEIGGGGHKDASGAAVKGLDFKEAVKVALKAARKFAKQKFTPEIPLD